MAFDNRGRGSIWKNDRKTEETHPDFTGSYTDENGREFWVSAWKRKPDAAVKAPALTFSMKPKDAEKAKPAPQRPRPLLKDEMDDNIPW